MGKTEEKWWEHQLGHCKRNKNFNCRTEINFYKLIVEFSKPNSHFYLTIDNFLISVHIGNFDPSG
jgi:hypothetical protein